MTASRISNVFFRVVVPLALVVATGTSGLAQNSSLMHPPGMDPGRSSFPRVVSPRMPGANGPPSIFAEPRSTGTPAVVASSRYDGLSPSGQTPDRGLGSEAGMYPPNDPRTELGRTELARTNLGQSPYDPQVSPYDAPYDPYQSVERPAISLNEASWTYQPAPPVRVFRKNDVITIRVDEITRMMAEGAAQQRKRTLSEVILTDWIRLRDFRFEPDPQEEGDPAVAAESNENFLAQAFVQSRESLTFNIAATVVDIRPNGNLVLEARKTIRVNENLWETALSGMCRAEDIAPDNVVLSKDLIDLEIRKEDQGQLRDSYSRGWLKRIIDRFGPF